MNLPAATNVVNADSGVAINENNFPDENFRNWVSEKSDENNDGYLCEAEIARTKYVLVEDKGISDLKGIEYFTSMVILQ